MSTILVPHYSNHNAVTEASLDSDGKLVVQDKENVDDILRMNAYERGISGDKYFGKGTQTSMKKLGSISPVMMMNLVEQGIFWDDKKLRAWFKDLDNYLWSVKGHK